MIGKHKWTNGDEVAAVLLYSLKKNNICNEKLINMVADILNIPKNSLHMRIENCKYEDTAINGLKNSSKKTKEIFQKLKSVI